jgi:hypothetical protein
MKNYIPLFQTKHVSTFADSLNELYKNTLRNKIIVFYLIAIFIVPPLAISTRVIPPSSSTNFVTLTLCTLLCFSITRREKWKWNDLNLHENNTFVAHVIFVITGMLFIWFMHWLFDLPTNSAVIKKPLFLICIIPFCVLQVFSYKVFLIKILENFTTSKIQLIILSTFFFTFMHIMFSWKFIIICLFGGIGFSYMYLHHRNVTYISISHIILNFFTALMGAFERT